MAGTNQFIPFAVGSGAFVLTPAAYAAQAAVSGGFSNGVADTALCNTIFRQSTFVSAAVAQFMADASGQNVNDDGVVSNFEKTFGIALNLAHYAVDTGTANAYVATYSPAIPALYDGLRVRFRAINTNTGASTLNVNGIGAKPIWGAQHSALTGGEIVATGEVEAVWNSALNTTGAWVLLKCTGGAQQLPSGSYCATPTAGDSSTKIANMAAVGNEISARKGIARFLANGSFTVPANVTKLFLSGCAGGGGGASCQATNSTNQASGSGGGGGAGQQIFRAEYTVTPGQVINIVIGAGGLGAVSGGAVGGNGGNTVIGSLITLFGGSGGALGTVVVGNGIGGFGGAGYPKGGDGSDAAVTAAGGCSGAGADSMFGAGGTPVRNSTGNARAGNSASGYGAGGSGSGGITAGLGAFSSAQGGTGADGFALIEW